MEVNAGGTEGPILLDVAWPLSLGGCGDPMADPGAPWFPLSPGGPRDPDLPLSAAGPRGP